MKDLSQKCKTTMSENGLIPSVEESEEQPGNPALAFHKRLVERSKKIPQEDLDKFPRDFSENLDHYLYDMPKKSP